MNPSSEKTKKLSVCLVHDWLVAMRGGEKVLEVMTEIFPDAPIYTLFANPGNLSPQLRNRTIYTSFLQRFPGILKWYRWLLPIFPFAIRTLDLSRYDVVISISHCVAKSVRVRKNAIHICYCNAPIRYAWDLTDDYLRTFPRPIRILIETYFKWLRKWDHDTAQDVNYFIGNSINIASKIKKYYGREAVFIYPPVDIKCDQKVLKGDYFLSVGALVPYKRIDLLIEAFNQLNYSLKIVGDGPCRTQLQQLIRNPEIQLEGWLDDDALKERYVHAQALIFPGEEDFGIVPVEMQRFGKPVIAFGKGGIVETVLPHTEPVDKNATKATGLFFYSQTAKDLLIAIQRFEELKFDSLFIQTHSEKFGRDRFHREFQSFFDAIVKPPALTERAVST